MYSTEPIDEACLAAAVRRYRQLAAVKAEIETEQASIVAFLSERTEVGWSIEVDGVAAQKRHPRRKFSLPLAVGLLTPEEREACKAMSFNAELVRETVEAKGLLDDAMEPGTGAASMYLR